MEASSSARDKSSRMKDQSLRKSSSGKHSHRLRRRPSSDRHSEVVNTNNNNLQDVSLQLHQITDGSGSSGYSHSTRRTASNSSSIGSSGSFQTTANTSNVLEPRAHGRAHRSRRRESGGHHHNSNNNTNSSSEDLLLDARRAGYSQKYQAAQVQQQQLLMGEGSLPLHNRQVSRRRCGAGLASSYSEDLIHSKTVIDKNSKSLLQKYKLISKVASSTRRQSMKKVVMEDSSKRHKEAPAATTARPRADSPILTVTPGSRRPRRASVTGTTVTRGVARIPSSSKTRPVTAQTATFLKKAFSHDRTDRREASPVRGVRPQSSMPQIGLKTTRRTSMSISGRSRSNSSMDKSSSATSSRRMSMPLGNHGSHVMETSRGRSMATGSASNGSGSGSDHSGTSSSSTGPQPSQQRRGKRRPSTDFASRTSWDKPKPKPKASMAVEALLETSIPSLVSADATASTASIATSQAKKGVSRQTDKDKSRARRMSMPSQHSSGSDNSASGGRNHSTRQSQRSSQRQFNNRRPSQDLASRTSWDAPKPKPKASMHYDALMDVSMPSLAALDLSTHHAGGGKRSSDASTVYTMSTRASDATSALELTPFRPVLQKNTSIFSLMVDNAPSHNTGGLFEEEDVDDLEEASTICNSVGDFQPPSIESLAADTTSSKRKKSRSFADGSSRDDRCRRQSSSRLDAPSRRRRALSTDESSSKRDLSRSRRRQSPRRTLSSRSSGNQEPSMRQSHDGRRAERRATMATSRATSRERGVSRATSSASLSKSRHRGHRRARSVSRERRFGRTSSSRSLDRRRGGSVNRSKSSSSLGKNRSERGASTVKRNHATSSFSPTRQPSSSSLQQRNRATSASPRRQKSTSSLNTGSRKLIRRASSRIKKQTSTKSLEESLSQLETAWLRENADVMAASDNGTGLGVPRVTEDKSCLGSMGAKSASSGGSFGADSSGRSQSGRIPSTGRRRPRRHRSNGTSDISEKASLSREPDNHQLEGLASIDFGPESRYKAEMDESVMTPPTVSSSLEDFTLNSTPKERSQKKTPSSRTLMDRSCNKRNGTLGNRESGVKNDFKIADGSDPFQIHGEDLFDLTANEVDQFELCKNGNNLGFLTKKDASKRSMAIKLDDGLGPSFHLTNEFGDFANDDSFGQVSFDDSYSTGNNFEVLSVCNEKLKPTKK